MASRLTTVCTSGTLRSHAACPQAPGVAAVKIAANARITGPRALGWERSVWKGSGSTHSHHLLLQAIGSGIDDRNPSVRGRCALILWRRRGRLVKRQVFGPDEAMLHQIVRLRLRQHAALPEVFDELVEDFHGMDCKLRGEV